MSYGETKVYFDGSHYIAIPHTERKNKYRPKRIEEGIIVTQETGGPVTEKVAEPLIPCMSDETSVNKQEGELSEQMPTTPIIRAHTTTRKELFDELYKKYIMLKKRERKERIIEEMMPYFDTVEETKTYVDIGFERKLRNLICRRVRMVRKANLANFNYFCTFTYDDKLHSEDTFKKSLQTCFRNFCYRKAWKYMGVWERSPEKQRLHFHGLFAIPENAMVGMLFEKTDYSFKTHRMQTTVQNTYFNENFGRSDFEDVVGIEKIGESLGYLMKYIEKDGEKIVYSKGLYQYFISDIMDEDVVCRIGQEDKKLLLFDDFNCWDEGMYMGRVSSAVISQLRKSN